MLKRTAAPCVLFKKCINFSVMTFSRMRIWELPYFYYFLNQCQFLNVTIQFKMNLKKRYWNSVNIMPKNISNIKRRHATKTWDKQIICPKNCIFFHALKMNSEYLKFQEMFLFSIFIRHVNCQKLDYLSFRALLELF